MTDHDAELRKALGAPEPIEDTARRYYLGIEPDPGPTEVEKNIEANRPLVEQLDRIAARFRSEPEDDPAEDDWMEVLRKHLTGVIDHPTPPAEPTAPPTPTFTGNGDACLAAFRNQGVLNPQLPGEDTTAARLSINNRLGTGYYE